MIIVLALIAFALGVLTSDVLLLVIAIAFGLILITFVAYRFGVKKSLVTIATFLSGVLITHLPISYKNKEEYKGIVYEVKENYFLFQSGLNKFYIQDKNTSFEVGDILSVKGDQKEFCFKTYESQFDFKDYLFKKGVKKELTLKSYTFNFKNPLRLTSKKKRFLANFKPPTANLIDAILFNHKDYNDEVISTASSLNLIHLLAMNGVYLYFFLRIFNYLFSLFLDDKKARVCSFLFLSPYFLFSLNKVGVLRIILMQILRFINDYFLKKKFNYLTLLGILGFIFLLSDFHYLYQPGFYLGFMVSLILCFLRGSLRRYKKRKKALITTFIIYVFIFPFVALNNNELHIFTFFFQLLLLPINELFALISVVSFYTIPFKNLLNFYGQIISKIIISFSKIDLKIPFPKTPQIFTMLLYLQGFYGLILLEQKRKKDLNNASLVLLILLLLPLIPIRPFLYNAVYFINVGQGDSILIHNKNVNVLIDTGGSLYFDMAKETLIPFFHKVGVRKIDLLITTHNDMDHCYAKDSLMENFPVKEYRHKNEEFPYRVGDLYFNNLNHYVAKDENDKSLVFNLSFMNKKWLLLGDASIDVEKQMIKENLDLDCDIIKVGHHGSKYSTSEDFLLKTSPDIAIISCGVNNKYGHPSKRVMDLLNKYQVKIRRTDVEGTISFEQFALF